MSELSLDQIRRALLANGATRAYAKRLAPNDNSKNQVYVGRDFGVLNILPSGEPVPGDIAAGGKPHFKARLNLWWMGRDGTLHRAPSAQLILYSRHEEVRLSGYLTGVAAAHRPSRIMGTVRTPERVLFLGVRNDGAILAYAVGPDSPAAREVRALANPEMNGVFITIALGGSLRIGTRGRLLAELCRVSRLGWIASKKLDASGVAKPYHAQNGGGYTLEAELGIKPNGYAEPDFHGWEVKQFAAAEANAEGSGRITLMTPEPNDGFYVSRGVVAFVEKYGYADLRGRPNRMNFGGTFKAGVREGRTGLTLRLLGYDSGKSTINDPAGGIALIDDRGNEAAVWRYASLLAHWNRKHASAAYVPSTAKGEANERAYRYSSSVKLGTGTSFNHFLASIDANAVIYDPGIKVENYPATPKPKKRSQFRCNLRHLAALYDSFDEVNACAP